MFLMIPFGFGHRKLLLEGGDRACSDRAVEYIHLKMRRHRVRFLQTGQVTSPLREGRERGRGSERKSGNIFK